MNEQQTTQHAAGGRAYERCLCREILDRVRDCFVVSPNVRQHLVDSRIEFLRAIREVVDERIQHLSSRRAQGTKVTVE